VVLGLHHADSGEEVRVGIGMTLALWAPLAVPAAGIVMPSKHRLAN
jgi:hypothetical protein